MDIVAASDDVAILRKKSACGWQDHMSITHTCGQSSIVFTNNHTRSSWIYYIPWILLKDAELKVLKLKGFKMA